jgi:GxxExxY protein
MRELELRKISSVNQRLVEIEYKGLIFEEQLRFDVLVEGCLLLEIKCIQKILPVHEAQLLSYMKLMNIPLGLVMNFHEPKLVKGVARIILPGANVPDSNTVAKSPKSIQKRPSFPSLPSC